MFTTAVIGFREFLEAFLIVGIFLGVSQKLALKKEMEIGFAAVVGMILALLLNIGVFFLGEHTRSMITEQNADAIESYLQIFSGLFLVYVVFSLHQRMNQNRKEMLTKAKENIKKEFFDISLFFTIIFLVLREGFEIALFSSSITLFSLFVQNIIGLLLGFVGAAILGALTYFAYTKFSIGKIYKVTEYMIVLLGASLFQTGITKFLDTHFTFSLSNVGSFHMNFLPQEDSFVGTLLQGFFGVDNHFSAARLIVMFVYISAIYFLFLHKQNILQRLMKGK
ncbi:MAG TPA: FTR1 family protein [Candidatus Acidoferrales bacterium]|nr:FTR1 family protein [Candidatus Acidoferrales bacterium]